MELQRDYFVVRVRQRGELSESNHFIEHFSQASE